MKTFGAEKYQYLLFFSIILLAIFFRFYKLGSIPLGLNQDETAIGYNAYSILKTGKDEYGTFRPLYFRSFDDYKLPVYIYLTSGVEKVFGVNAFSIRFTSAFFGVLAVIVMYFLVLLLSGKKTLALIASFFLSVNPWHVFFSRVGSEVNVATSLALIGVFFFVWGISVKPKILPLFFSLLAFGLSLYCYNVTRLVAPILFLLLIGFYRKKLQLLPKWSIMVFSLIFVLILLPFVITLTSHSGLQNQQGTVLLTGIGFHVKALEFRSYLPDHSGIIAKLFFSSWVFILWQYIQNVISFFSPNFYFLTGATNPINGILNIGMFNLADFIFITVGLYMGIKRKEKYLYYFYLWLAAVILVGSITIEVPHPTRSYLLIPPMIIFSAYGALTVLEYLKHMKNKLQYVGLFSVCAIFLYSLFFYMISYFFRFPTQYAKSWRSEDREVAAYIQENGKKYDKIVFDTRADYAYTSLLFYTKLSPDIYQKNAIYQKEGLLNGLKTLGKISFHEVDWKSEYTASEKILFITSPSALPGYGVLKTFFYPTRPVVNFSNNQITSYPYSEPAYVAIETVSSYEKK